MVLIGFIFSAAVFSFALQHSNYNFLDLINQEGLVIVVGGTFAIALSSSRPKALYQALQGVFRLFFKASNIKKLQNHLRDVSQQLEQGQTPSVSDYLLVNRAVEYMQAGIPAHKLEELLLDQAEVELSQYRKGSELFSNLAKYPPALGMIGTVFGIVGIFSTLNNPEAKSQLGANLAFAMTATLYGLVVANFLLSPLAEGLDQEVDKKITEANLIIGTFKLISEREASLLIEEKIKHYDAA